jgi:chromate reductase
MSQSSPSTSTQYQIAVIVGSLRKESINRQLAGAVARLAPPDFTFIELEIGDLPLYNQDDDLHQAAPVLRLKAQVAGCRGVLFVTPEYNRSFPGVLKNAIDHASRPYGHSAWNGKPAAIIGVTPSATGTAIAQQHLRVVLANQDMPTLNQPEMFLQKTDQLFDDSGAFGAGSIAFAQGWMDRYAAWVRRHAAG